MKQIKNYFYFWVIGLLIIALVLTTSPIFASKSKAQQFYNQGESYAAEGRWDLAADAYAQVVKEYAKYKDVQAKLENARQQASIMLVQMGDEAKNKEKFEEALALYKKALLYNPASVDAKSKLDNLSQDMVTRYYNLGRTYESQNQLQNALKEYEKAYTYNPNYQDVTDRYTRIKAKLQGNIPLRAILFFINRSSQLGMETPFIQSLQSSLTDKAKESGKFSMIDYRKVQAVMEEQATGLGDNLNQDLAMDLGRILGVNEVIIGEIVSEGKDSNKFKINAKVLKVPQGELVKEVKISHKFSGKEMADFQKEIPDLARDLADKLTSSGLF
jgi:tetratricopeptide (TPR) repeat protein